MKLIKSKKGIALLATLAVAVVAAVGAYAYWTASGTGSGTASVGTDAGVTINNFGFSGALYPGHSVTVTFDIVNNSANTKAKVGKVVADTSGGNTNGISGLPVGCSAADFHFADVTVNTEIGESATDSGVTGTLSMDDTAVNQDACKNAAPVLHLKTDNSGI
jgi:hypothetical protein